MNKTKWIYLLIILVLLSVSWYMGSAKSGQVAIEKKINKMALNHLQEKYSDLEFKILNVSYNLDKNTGVFNIETTVDDLTFSFITMVYANDDKVEDKLIETKTEIIYENKINEVINLSNSKDKIAEVRVYPRKNIKGNYDIDLHVFLTDIDTQQQFTDIGWEIKELIKSANINVSSYSFKSYKENGEFTLFIQPDKIIE